MDPDPDLDPEFPEKSDPDIFFSLIRIVLANPDLPFQAVSDSDPDPFQATFF